MQIVSFSSGYFNSVFLNKFNIENIDDTIEG